MTSKYSVELFMEACNALGPLHLSVEDANRPGPVRRVFHQPFVVIGRDPTTDLLLDHRRVSRRHTYLQIVRGRLFSVDLGSRTGTTWNDDSKEPGWLDSGRSIFVGPYEIGLWSQGEPAPEDQVIPWPAGIVQDKEPPSSYSIDFLTQAAWQPSVSIDQNLALVGNSASCRVRLPYSDVSKAHCSLLQSPHGVWVVDLLGRGGTFVNDTHVRFARLDDGDELRIGRHLLRFQINEPKPRPRPPVSPSRVLARRSSDNSLAKRPERPAIPPSSGVPMVPVWHYPDTEIQRALNGGPPSQVELIQALMQPMVQQFGQMQQQMFEQFHLAMMGMFQTFGAAHREQMSEFREELDEVRRLTKELQELQTQAASRNEADLRARAAQSDAAALTETRVPKLMAQPDHKAEPELEEPAFRPPLTKSDLNVHDLLFDRIASLQNERQTRWQKILAKMNLASQ